MKPPSPLHTPNTAPLKPPSPLHPKIAPKTPISRPQRRWRFQTTGPARLQHPHAAPVGGDGTRSAHIRMQFPHAHFTPRHTIVEIPGYSQSNEPQAPNHPSARQAPQVWRAPEARLRHPWAAAGPGQATHRHPRPNGGRREACGAWPGFEPTRRANHQHTRPHRCGGRRRAWLRRPWAAAGPGRASRATTPSEARVWRSRGRAAAHGRTKQPGPTRHPTRQRPSFNKRSLCRQRLGGADLGGPAAGQPRRDQRGHDGHDAHADQL